MYGVGTGRFGNDVVVACTVVRFIEISLVDIPVVVGSGVAGISRSGVIWMLLVFIVAIGGGGGGGGGGRKHSNPASQTNSTISICLTILSNR